MPRGPSRPEPWSDSKPLVSIGLPVFNGEPFLRAAIESLLAQDYENLELIVSDNASTDDTPRICEEFAERDQRVRLHRFGANQGPVLNFRRVLEMARGAYFMFAAADDRWHPAFVRTLLEELENHRECGVAMSGIEVVTENGDPFVTIRFTGSDDPNHRSHYGMLKGLTSSRKYSLFIYGLFRTSLLRRAMPLFPVVLGGDRIFMCQIALATRWRYVDRLLYSRTYQLAHADSYRRESRSGRVHVRQIVHFTRILATSPVVPVTRRLYLVPGLVRYAVWSLTKAYGSARLWKRVKRHLERD